VPGFVLSLCQTAVTIFIGVGISKAHFVTRKHEGRGTGTFPAGARAPCVTVRGSEPRLGHCGVPLLIHETMVAMSLAASG
jgi:hypothetical protein